MSKYVIDSSTLISIANAVREKGGTTEAIVVSQIPDKIYSINGGGYAPTDEDLTFKENSNYLFAYDNYDWLIKNFANRINCGIQGYYTFYNCRKLRDIPSVLFENNIIKLGNYTFNGCNILDKLEGVDLNSYKGGVSFQFPLYYCSCLRDIIFKTNNDGTPYVYTDSVYIEKIQITSVGYVSNSETSAEFIAVQNAFGSEKRVTDATSYQALKNDPDWWTTDIAYSKYNHDSAVRTLNSLPDVSISGSGSGISFEGKLGSSTDAGAVNTLTSSEIAVATAKGWTVSFT